MKNSVSLDEFEESILTNIKEHAINDQHFGLGVYQTHARIVTDFRSDQNLSKKLKSLITKDLIEEVRYDHDNKVHLWGYKLTPRGSNYLRKMAGVPAQQFTNISDSNIAVDSTDTKQLIKKIAQKKEAVDKELPWWIKHIVFPLMVGVILLLISVYVFGVYE